MMHARIGRLKRVIEKLLIDDHRSFDYLYDVGITVRGKNGFRAGKAGWLWGDDEL